MVIIIRNLNSRWFGTWLEVVARVFSSELLMQLGPRYLVIFFPLSIASAFCKVDTLPPRAVAWGTFPHPREGVEGPPPVTPNWDQ
jgi:hypothetical protein